MKLFKQKELKNMVELGVATDITPAGYDVLDDERPFEKIGFSRGVNGLNGGLIRGKSGRLYAICARNTLLARYF